MAMRLIVGLGNPGAGYAKNRHNAGFMAVDAIAERYLFPNFQQKFRGLLSEGRIAEQKIFLFKPLTYMNLSGEAVGELCRFYQIPAPEVVVLHDELDLPLGSLRVKQGGGHGGHNGLKSLDAHLGKDYWRIRLGIGHPGHKDLVSDYVLGDFGKEEKRQISEVIEEVAHSLPKWLQGDLLALKNI